MTRITELLAARMERIRKGEKTDAGFTLIELLVVVIIIGILAAIAIPVFLNQRQSAWKASVQSDVHNATLQVETYSTANSGSVAGLNGSGDVYCGTNAGTGCTATASPIVTTVKASDGNKITITKVSSTSYTVAASNVNVTGTGSTYTFSSATGASAWS